MHYLADTANLKELEQLYRFFPLAGVTTNPTIIKRSGLKLSRAIEGIDKIVGGGMFHIQLLSLGAEEIVQEAIKYKEQFGLGDNFYAKVPVTPEGLRAMTILKDRGINVTATAIFTPQQALVSARAGADFVAPYVNRLDNFSGQGVQLVADIGRSFELAQLNTQILAASFISVDQVQRVCLAGAGYVTLPYDLLMRSISHPMTDLAVMQFMEDGKAPYDIGF